jgi:hypothetical protein
MAGIKGRSGRKSKSDELKRLEIIECAWNIVGEFLRSDAKINEKMPEAVKIVLKTIQSDIYMKTDNRSITIMPTIAVGGKPLEFDFGDK